MQPKAVLDSERDGQQARSGTVVTQPRPILVNDETRLTAILDEAASRPVRLEREGVIYRVVREDMDPWAGYDPERVRSGLRRFAGSVSVEAAERMKASVYRAREDGTRPSTHP